MARRSRALIFSVVFLCTTLTQCAHLRADIDITCEEEDCREDNESGERTAKLNFALRSALTSSKLWIFINTASKLGLLGTHTTHLHWSIKIRTSTVLLCLLATEARTKKKFRMLVAFG
jgi:hypothetical protein